MSKTLELRFASKKDKNVFYDDFCFAPSRNKERAFGWIYLIGEIRNLEGKCAKFLAVLAKIIEREYYKNTNIKPQDSFRSALQKANLWLLQITKKEKVNLQGNLNFSVLSVLPDMTLNFTKIGGLKTILSRQGEIFNLGEKISSGNMKFSDIIEGKLEQNDKIITFSKNISLILEKERLLKQLASSQKEKEIKSFFKTRKKLFNDFSGLGVIIIIKQQKFFFPSLKISERGAIFKFFEKILPKSPKSKIIIKRLLISFIILGSLLILGFLIFH